MLWLMWIVLEWFHSYSFFNTVREREPQISNKGDLIPQQIALTQQPSRVSINIPNIPISYQTVKAEVYEPIAKILDSKWERDYYAKDEFDG